MQPNTAPLTLKQGSTFAATFIRKRKSDGEPIDNTGFAARMHVRHDLESDEVLLHFSSEDDGTADGLIILGGADGSIRLEMGATATAAVDFARAVYDIELYDPADPDNVECVLGGTIVVGRNVTRGEPSR